MRNTILTGLTAALLAISAADAQAIGYHFTRDVSRDGVTAHARGCTTSGKFGVYHFTGRIHYRSAATTYTTVVKWTENIRSDGVGRRLSFVSVRFTGEAQSSEVRRAVRRAVARYINDTRVRYLGPDGGQTLHYAGPWTSSNFNVPFHPSPGGC